MFEVVPVDGEVRLSIGKGAAARCTLKPGEAIGAALALLGAAGQALGNGEDDAIGIPRFSYRFDPEMREEVATTLIIKHAKAAMAFPFSATQFAEFTAEAIAICKKFG
ncbi:hypothetical protein [Novosphingobium sp. ST904]|nr:hypothetical protein [Novosphingobium sp. ST904]